MIFLKFFGKVLAHNCFILATILWCQYTDLILMCSYIYNLFIRGYARNFRACKGLNFSFIYVHNHVDEVFEQQEHILLERPTENYTL